MAWSQLDITKPHLVYIILGGFTSLFMLCSSFIKERMYIGEATVATLCGVIFGPHAANLINPEEWGNVDIVTIEFSRIVLVVQCFAVGVELPKFYMEKHWRSVVMLLVPVMTFGWLIVSLFIWWMIPPFDWLDSLVVAACVTATDPVLASSVVGKGKFAKRVPKHLRDLLSAESGCNDGMAFPFIYLSLYLIQYHRNAGEVSLHFVAYVILYECIFGAIFGFLVGYIARHGIRIAHEKDLIDRESFLVFYFVVALFCAGSGSILGVDDLLVGFAAGVGFSNDGWFGEKTEESHVSNVIDLLINLTYFVFLGTIIPWEQFNSNVEGLVVWRLVVIAVFVIFFRRIPIMLALKPFIPDVKSWREALFAGHFGPIGVGAIFVAILARAELEHEEPVPLSKLPPDGSPHYTLIYLLWPIVTFLVITSILIHGSSIAVFTLGKRINTLTLTMSYTAAPEDGPTWMNRLPRISSQLSKSAARTMSQTSIDDMKEENFSSPGLLSPPSNFLSRRREKDDDNPSRPNSRASSLVRSRRKKSKWDDGLGPGGPVSDSAYGPQSRTSIVPPSEGHDSSPPTQEATDSTLAGDSPKDKDPEKLGDIDDDPGHTGPAPRIEVYEEGDDVVVENQDGDVLDFSPSPGAKNEEPAQPAPALTRPRSKTEGDQSAWGLGAFRRKMSEVYTSELEKRKEKGRDERRHEPARAYQFGNTIIVEDDDGEVIKTYELPAQREGQTGGSGDLLGTSLKYMGLGGLSRGSEKPADVIAEEGEAGETSNRPPPTRPAWTSLLGGDGRRKSVAQQSEIDDKKIRFTIGGVGQRMTKEDFIREVQKLDEGTRKEVVEHSNASLAVQKLAQQEPASTSPSRLTKIAENVPARSRSDSNRQRAPRRRSESISPGRQPAQASSSRSPVSSSERASEQVVETAAERKRRLAVLASQSTEDTGETPAERRRREAALGMGGPAAVESSSEDEDEEQARLPPARRGIRFAEPTRRA